MTKQAKTLNEQELKKLLQAAANTKASLRNRVIILLTHYAGMRIGEVAAVKVGDVLGKNGEVLEQINLSAAQTKGDKSSTRMA